MEELQIPNLDLKIESLNINDAGEISLTDIIKINIEFKMTDDFKYPETKLGIVLKKPSGLMTIKIVFKTTTEKQKLKDYLLKAIELPHKFQYTKFTETDTTITIYTNKYDTILSFEKDLLNTKCF